MDNNNSNEIDTGYHLRRIEFAQKLYETDGSIPHRYVFVLTNLCNLRCSFCFQEKDYIRGSLSTEDWLRVVSELPEYAWVTLTGGEPFLFKGFDAVFDVVTRKHGCNIISNGVMLDERRIELLLSKPNFKVLSISIDNVGNTLRGIKPEEWSNAEKMMREFVRRRNEKKSLTTLDSKTVVLDDNADQLLAIHKYCVEELQCDTHSFQLLKGSPLQHADHMFPFEAIFPESAGPVYSKFETITEQLELIRQYNIATGKKCFVHPKIANLNGSVPIRTRDLAYINERTHIKANFQACKTPWESVHINVDGNVFPCMAISMGNVKDQSLQNVLRSADFCRFKQTIKDEGTVNGCNRCGYLLPEKSAIAAESTIE